MFVYVFWLFVICRKVIKKIITFNGISFMKYSILISFILFLSCSSFINRNDDLLKIESIINDFPDSALVLLNSIERSSLKSKEAEARYSLLYAMALDKNYIDICSDSIIAPALEYYTRKGSNDDKLKVNYYRGIIGRNTGDNEEAMKFYVVAERYASKSTDYQAVGRLYNAMMRVYVELFEYRAAYESAKSAANAYNQARDIPKFYDAILDILHAGFVLNFDEYEKYIKVINEGWEDLTVEQRARYYLIILSSNLYQDTSMVILEDYFGIDIEDCQRDWLIIAHTYYKHRDYSRTREALDKHIQYCPYDADNPEYMLLMSLLMEGNGEYQESISKLRESLVYLDEMNIRIFESDAKFLEERYERQIKIQRANHIMIIIAMGAILIILTISVLLEFSRRRRVEFENKSIRFEDLYKAALCEQKRLKKSRKDTALGKNVRLLVDERLEVLNKFVAANISCSFTKSASVELEKLMADQEYFLESTRQSFVIAHPQFLMFLKECNLSSKEIGCCCLYCIGLNGSEIASYLERKSFYNISYAIRQKLHLDRSVNLDTFLRKKMKELDQPNSTF